MRTYQKTLSQARQRVSISDNDCIYVVMDTDIILDGNHTYSALLKQGASQEEVDERIVFVAQQFFVPREPIEFEEIQMVDEETHQKQQLKELREIMRANNIDEIIHILYGYSYTRGDTVTKITQESVLLGTVLESHKVPFSELMKNARSEQKIDLHWSNYISYGKKIGTTYFADYVTSLTEI